MQPAPKKQIENAKIIDISLPTYTIQTNNKRIMKRTRPTPHCPDRGDYNAVLTQQRRRQYTKPDKTQKHPHSTVRKLHRKRKKESPF